MKILDDYRAAARATGQPLLALLRQAWGLRRSAARLGLTEYLDFRLYDRHLTAADLAAFAGVRTQSRLEEILVDDLSRFMSIDKVTMYALMRAYGLPTPTLRAVYGASRPQACQVLRTPAQLAQFLRQPGNLPAYVKRSFGVHGFDNLQVLALDGDTLQLSNGTQPTVDAFCAALDDARGLGWLFQEPLQAHPDIARFTGSAKVSGLRVHTFLVDGEVVITRAIFKMNFANRDADNYLHGRVGNLLGDVDVQTGVVRRAVAGSGASLTVNPPNPHTGAEVVGFQLPHWPALVALLKDAALAFPGYICPGWDIALCPDGPKLLEVNYFGDVDLPQYASGTGFVDAPFVALMQRRGLAPLMAPDLPGAQRRGVNGRLGARRHHWRW